MIITYAEDGGVNKIEFASKKAEEKWNTLSVQEQKKLDKLNNIKSKGNVSDLDLNNLYSNNAITKGIKKLIAKWGGKKGNNNKLYETLNAFRYGTGRATVFGDTIGQANHRLKKGDVATKLKYDNVICGIPVVVTMKIKGSKKVKSVTMKKWDAGSMPDAIIDIWKTGINYWGYKYSKTSLKNWKKTGVAIFHGK